MKSFPALLPFRTPVVFFVVVAALWSATSGLAQATSYTFTTLAGLAGSEGYTEGTGASSRFAVLEGLAVDSNGNIYVSDAANDVIRKITTAGVVSTFITAQLVNNAIVSGGFTGGGFYTPGALAVDSKGNLYFVNGNQIWEMTTAGALAPIAGNGQSGSQDGPAFQAEFYSPQGLAVDKAGNVYVADAGNSTVRMISTAGTVSTVAGVATVYGTADGTGSAARFSQPSGIAVDSSGNLYVTDAGTNFTIRKITSGGVVTTLAGTAGAFGNVDGTGAAAEFSYQNAIAIDANGNLFVTQGNNVIREITSSGAVTTIAGMPGTAGSADGTGAKALFNDPFGIAVDANGNVFVADSHNYTIRERYVAANSAPSIGTEPASQSAAIGGSATLTVAAAGVPAPSYQWLLNGSAVQWATNPTLTIPDVQATNLGTYTVTVADSSGSVTSAGATLSSPGVAPAVPAPVPARLVNISSRASVATGANAMIAGFVVTGPPGSTEQVLIRGIGPALVQFGITNPLQQPVLTLFDSKGNQIATDTSWEADTNFTQVVAAEFTTGAFALVYDTNDSALLVSLPPGSYTAQVTSGDGTTGVALAEVYEVSSSNAELTNISTRAFVGTGASVEIAGIVVGGAQSQKLLVRAVGPTLAQYGVTGPLAQTSLSLVDSAGNQVATNTGWSTGSNSTAVASATTAAGAFPLPQGSADSALVVTLAPGSYTAVVSGVGTSTGIALVEVYVVP